MKIHKCNKSNLYNIVFLELNEVNNRYISFNDPGWYLDPGEYGVQINFCPFGGEKL